MKNQTLIHSLAIATVLGLVGFFGFSYFEPGLLSAQSDDDDIIVTQVVDAGISISEGADITLTPLSIFNDTAVGSTNWTVRTNASSGYSLTVFSSANGLYDSNISNSFTNIGQTFNTWANHTNTPDYYWGFRAFGPHVDTGDYGTATQCGDGQDPEGTNQNWRGFDSGNYGDPIQIASHGTVTSFTGDVTNFCIGTEQTGVFAPSGTYTATITATATVNP